MKRSIFSLLGILLLASACQKMDPEDERTVRYYANTFAYNVMNTYYLWKDEVSDKIENWVTTEDPIKKVEAARYEMDKWTALYDNFSDVEGYFSGNLETFGLSFTLYYYDEAMTQVCAVVTYTYENSPARKAGLQRGDIIVTVDGELITPDNYPAQASKLWGTGSISLGLEDGRTVSLQSVQMYENPVHTATTFDYGGKRFGYLHFTSFTLDSCPDLETVFGQFKAEGITDLILDLRYNGGGYVTTSTALASMIAPPDVVKAKKVYNKDIYNDNLTQSEQDATRFEPEFTYEISSGQEVTVHPLEVNPGIEHLWAIVTDDSASASEALICGLKPYMDVTLVGQQTYGKFTGCILLSATEWFDSITETTLDIEEGKAALPNWGIYLVVSRYADCNGVTLSMPDGITPDYAAKDRPKETFPLGDPSEKMLAATLSIATGGPAPASVKSVSAQAVPEPIHRPGFGVLIH
jgi:C-terminal processing protease CtpA/Prc